MSKEKPDEPGSWHQCWHEVVFEALKQSPNALAWPAGEYADEGALRQYCGSKLRRK